ncbi:MAG: GNAT family N-acetyltransferase [Planctomycetota bacterium]|nr:GNAT family N-acetyltransferase [Planctomycetota bacterium]
MDEIFRHFPLLTTSRLQLREMTQADAPRVLELYGDPKVVEFYDLSLFEDLDRALAHVRDRHREFHEHRGIRWVATEQGGADQLVGTVGLHGIHATHRYAELGYAVHPAHWRRGIGLESVQRVVNFGFEDLGLRRIEAYVDPRNGGSLGLLERAGFRFEGTLRKRYWDGEAFQDDLLFARLSDD